MDKWVINSEDVKKKNNDDILETKNIDKSEKLSSAVFSDVNKKIDCSVFKKKNRKYRDEFLRYGFIFCIFEGKELPLCVICKNRLSNECMKPAKLKRHLKAKHKEFSKNPEIYFRSIAESMEKGSTLLNKHTSIPEKALRASFELSYTIGKNMKPHTIGETLILPAALKITSTMFGEKYLGEVNTIPLSNDTVSRRIRHISQDIEKTLIDRIQNSPIFALQLDETQIFLNSPN